MTRLLLCWMIYALFIAGSGVAAAEEQLKPIFDGKTLDGWVQHGGKAEYQVEDGAIVGTTVPDTPNSFLCTRKHYGDFVLELEFKVDPVMNSGVQIRSHVAGENEAVNGNQKRAGTVYGYQVEIDPSDRAWTGGIYDESRRGWLYPLDKNDDARQAFQQNEWNKFRIECRGDSIKTWLNGVPAADLRDAMTASGFIGLQVHGVGNDAQKVGKQVRWRNIRLKELE